MPFASAAPGKRPIRKESPAAPNKKSPARKPNTSPLAPIATKFINLAKNNMGQIIIVTGTFSAGKTEIANVLEQHLGRVARVADGPHLVEIIKNEAHGLDGRQLSASHFHAWNADNLRKPHKHDDGIGHFPFTVLEDWIGREMFKRTVGEVVEKSLAGLPVVVELGVGRNGCQVSRADFSTAALIETILATNHWPDLKDKIASVIAVESDWERRLARNRRRSNEADGITTSWGMQEEGLRITYESDFSAWRELGIDPFIYNNNGDGVEGMDAFVREIVLPQIRGVEGNLPGKERI